MNDVLRNNLLFLQELKNYTQLLQMFKIENDQLIIGDIRVNLKDMDLKEILNANVLNNIDNLTEDDIKELFSIGIKSKESALLEENNNAEKFNDNPKIKNFKVIKKYREDGSYLEYPYFIDENNNIHILFNYAGTNILNVYQTLFLKNGGKVDGKELYQELERKMKNVELLPDYVEDEKLRETTKLESNIVNKTNNDERVYLNSEHGIYRVGENIYTFDADNHGLNKNTANNENEEQLATYNDEFNQESMYIENDKEKEANIINEEEYYMLIKYATKEEMPEIGLFEGFIEDVMKYEEYISPKIKAVLDRYNSYMMSLENKENGTTYELEALKRYKEMLERKDVLKSELNKDNVMIRTRKLEEQYDNSGFTLIYLILIGIIIIIIITIILLAK